MKLRNLLLCEGAVVLDCRLLQNSRADSHKRAFKAQCCQILQSNYLQALEIVHYPHHLPETWVALNKQNPRLPTAWTKWILLAFQRFTETCPSDLYNGVKGSWLHQRTIDWLTALCTTFWTKNKTSLIKTKVNKPHIQTWTIPNFLRLYRNSVPFRPSHIQRWCDGVIRLQRQVEARHLAISILTLKHIQKGQEAEWMSL